MSFQDAKDKLEKDLKSVSLNVLVWGPGKRARLGFQKRRQIQQTIKKELPNAEVKFSEDAALKALVPPGLSVPEQELLHLKWSDVCIVLDDSKGAGEEIAYFSGTSEAAKLFILTDKKYRKAKSFPAELRVNLNQVFYSKTEYRSCSVTGKAVTRTKIIALKKLVRQ